MKKYLLAVVTLLLFSSCSTVGKVPANSDLQFFSESEEDISTTSSVSTDVVVTTTINVSTSSETSSSETTMSSLTETKTNIDTETDTDTEVSETETTSSQPALYDENGAVVIENDPAEKSDGELIDIAGMLFESACKTQWQYTVGCPYTLDTAKYVTNDLGWQYYLITQDGINSMSDIENDYYKVFSDRYPNELSEVYMESGGRVYALNGERGSNIFYANSEITSLDSRSDDEIFFTVTNNYTGSPYDDTGSYTDTAEFSMVLGDDGVWRAGEFRLPY